MQQYAPKVCFARKASCRWQLAVVLPLPFEDYAKAYKALIDYGRVRGNVSLRDYNIDFGFENTNNWHNAHIRLDISSHDSRLKVTQTVQYETDSNMYEVFINEDTATDNTVSVFGGGV